jgi:hypothetical protein
MAPATAIERTLREKTEQGHLAHVLPADAQLPNARSPQKNPADRRQSSGPRASRLESALAAAAPIAARGSAKFFKTDLPHERGVIRFLLAGKSQFRDNS